MYPDYFAKREQWKKLRRESWEREVSLACVLPCSLAHMVNTWKELRFGSPRAEVQIPAPTVTLAPCLSDVLSLSSVLNVTFTAILEIG